MSINNMNLTSRKRDDVVEFLILKGINDNKIMSLIDTTIIVIKKLINCNKLTMETLPDLIIICMEVVENIKHINGNDKKKVTIGLIVRVIDDSNVTGMMEPFILRMLPGMIDNIIKVDKGKLHIDKSLYIMKLIRKFKCCVK